MFLKFLTGNSIRLLDLVGARWEFMTYFVFAFLLCLLFGVLAIACNPSPYYGALSLVLAAGAASCVLAYKGATFLSLVLFLIYLGGMAVVFAFTVALSSEPFPSA